MNAARTFEVFRQELSHNLRRPMFWVLLLLIGFMAWAMSQGHAEMSSGDARVGGHKAWLTSEFAVTQLLILMVSVVYVFFVSVAAGMSIIRDDEQNVGELLHATPLRPSEYVWGKYAAVLGSFLAVLGLHVGMLMLFNHAIPHAENVDSIGPFAIVNYLRPGLLFGAPLLILFTGACFAVGGLTRSPLLVFVFPVAVLLLGAFFLWEWSPVWLPLSVNRMLQFVDLTGLRWLKENWLLVDRGVDFYNTKPVGLDTLIVAQRVLCLFVGLGSVAWLQARFAARLRGTRVRVKSGAIVPAASANVTAPEIARVPLASFAMRGGAPGFVASVAEIMRTELRLLVRHPGLYLFVPLILVQVFGSELAVGPFDTRILLTPGTQAAGLMNTLTLLICMVILFYTTESLQRERSSGFGAIYYSTPIRTAAALAGKSIANALLGVTIVTACLLGCIVALLYQGRVAFSLTPFAVVWGLLLLPTFLVWTSFVSAAYAATSNRYATYAIGLTAMIASGWFQMRGKMNWVTNWDLWSATRWTDIAPFEFDRVPLLLNRLLVLSLAVLFTVLTVRLFERRERDATRLVHRLQPARLLASVGGLVPFLLTPAVLATALGIQVQQGWQGGVAKKQAHDYWKKNNLTWRDAPTPELAGVDLNVTIDPARRALRVSGWYDVVNATGAPLDRFPISINPRWTHLQWSEEAKRCSVENRAGLVVFRPREPLASGARMRLGFSYDGHVPDGASKNGGTSQEFILPQSVVLAGFASVAFVPQIGWSPDTGVEDEKNGSDPKEWRDDWYRGRTPAAMGMWARWYDVHMRVDAPADLMVNATGEKVADAVKGSRRVTEWRTDHPVRDFNLVAGHWQVKRRPGVEVAYDARHPYNVDEMLDALEGARRWYGEWFAPLPWKTLRLSEFAALPTYAQAPAGNITFSEGIGFLTCSKPDANAAFWIAAHEAAHQWWPNIAMAGNGPGTDVLSEGMAHFSAILLTGQVRGEEQRMAWCRQIEDRYANTRRTDSERPLVKIDGSLPAEGRIIYDKGGWAFWMLHRFLGPERSFAGLREYLETFRDSEDHAALEDYLAIMRRHAADTTAFDAFAHQWFQSVVVPHYLIGDVRLVRSGAGWQVAARVHNVGTGTMPVDVAAVAGTRFPHERKDAKPWQAARTTLSLAAGEERAVTIECAFQPEKLVIDPDVTVLMLERQKAEQKLRPEAAPTQVVAAR
jgi:ABC-type Na+ efflux pump permease subunit